MNSSKKQIAIIGGGVTGIFSIVMLKEEGLEPICFEKTDKYGGTWCYRDESVIGIASIMPTTSLNHSKEMGAFSNFPPKKEYNNYMKHSEFYQYMTEYVKFHDCEKHIHYNCEAISVKMADDYEESGKWSVTVKDTITGNVSTDIYDGAIIATGHFCFPKMPTYKNQEYFRGKIMHTHDLKEVTEFTKKRVLVVGIGCSALDAAVDTSNVTKQVYLSTRSGAHILNRLGPSGYPIDYIMLRRYLMQLLDYLPANFCSWYFETFYLDPRYDHRLFPVPPKYHAIAKDPILNDIITSKFVSGSVLQKPDIEYFTETGVVFSGENEVTEVDVVIMATGYETKFPFLEEGVLKQEEGRFNLYKCVFPTHLQHPTLAFIGFFNPFGPGFPPAELQARWIAHIFAGKGRLPSEEKMIEDVKERSKQNKKRYAPSELMSIRVDVIQYMDQLAVEFGVKPNFLKLFFTDFPLFLRLVFGPSLSYQYRLEGPHKWEGAREAIMACDERIFWSYCKREKNPKTIIQIIAEYFVNFLPRNFYLLQV